jgi:hypothetical protein
MPTPKRSYEERLEETLERAWQMSNSPASAAGDARRAAESKAAKVAADRSILISNVWIVCCCVGIVGVITSLFWWDESSEDSSSIGYSYSSEEASTRGYDDTALKYVGRERLRQQLKDPDSLQIISEEVLPANGNVGEGYRAVYRAKNGFGGYTTEVFETR